MESSRQNHPNNDIAKHRSIFKNYLSYVRPPLSFHAQNRHRNQSEQSGILFVLSEWIHYTMKTSAKILNYKIKTTPNLREIKIKVLSEVIALISNPKIYKLSRECTK